MTKTVFRAITTSVGYDDFLAITLPWSTLWFHEILVVTSPDDQKTQELVGRTPKAYVHVTDAFTRDGDKFNKGRALEEGLDVLGREGWICILDADILLPHPMPGVPVQPGYIYSPYRRICETEEQYQTLTVRGGDWGHLPVGPEDQSWVNHEYAGYFQLFHASDPVLPDRGWYDHPEWTTAQGCDTEFYRLWPKDRWKRITAFEVLHLGPLRLNWKGRITPRWGNPANQLSDTIQLSQGEP